MRELGKVFTSIPCRFDSFTSVRGWGRSGAGKKYQAYSVRRGQLIKFIIIVVSGVLRIVLVYSSSHWIGLIHEMEIDKDNIYVERNMKSLSSFCFDLFFSFWIALSFQGYWRIMHNSTLLAKVIPVVWFHILYFTSYDLR